MLVPPDSNVTTGARDPLTDHSARASEESGVHDARLVRFPPFIFFCADIEVRRALRDPHTCARELRKSLAQVAQLPHLRNYGRPLWAGYALDKLLQFAQLKLLGGKVLDYEPAHNEQQLFAVLSSRLALDVCAQNPRCMPLVEEAVGAYLRVVDGIDPSSGVMSTHAPSEPVLAQAAMDLLCTGSKWADSVTRLAHYFVQRGFVEKGLKGELYARLLLIVAQDLLYKRACGAAAAAGAAVADARTASYTLHEFLASLFGRDFGDYAGVMDAKLLQSRLNFTHFAVTDEPLTAEVLPELLPDLLRCRAALQLCFRQPYIDILIPAYQGSEDEELDPEKCVYVCFQIKNQAECTTPDAVLERKFKKVVRPAQLRRRTSVDDVTVPGNPAARSGGEDAGEGTNKGVANAIDAIAGLKLSDGEASSGSHHNTSGKAVAASARSSAPLPPEDGFVRSIGRPALFLLLDLGSRAGPRTTPVQILRTPAAAAAAADDATDNATAPTLWAIHARGCDKDVFPCIAEMEITAAVADFWAAMTSNGGLPDGLVNDPKKMMRFRKLDRGYRQ